MAQNPPPLPFDLVIMAPRINVISVNAGCNSLYSGVQQQLWETCPICQVKSEVRGQSGEFHSNPYSTKVCQNCATRDKRT